MQALKCLPLKVDDPELSIDEGDVYGDLRILDPVFTQNFGPFKKGEQVEELVFSLREGTLTEVRWTADMQAIPKRQMKVKLTGVVDATS